MKCTRCKKKAINFARTLCAVHMAEMVAEAGGRIRHFGREIRLSPFSYQRVAPGNSFWRKK